VSTAHTSTTITSLATAPETALALLILLSQLPRILYPDSPDIYTFYDPLALAVAEWACATERRWDLGGPGKKWKRIPAVRMWFLLPGGNSRDLEVLDRAIERAAGMVRDVGELVGGVWDGLAVAEARNLKRFLEGRREEREAKEVGDGR
jgi:uncharacterized protein (DUF924 family)